MEVRFTHVVLLCPRCKSSVSRYRYRRLRSNKVKLCLFHVQVENEHLLNSRISKNRGVNNRSESILHKLLYGVVFVGVYRRVFHLETQYSKVSVFKLECVGFLHKRKSLYFDKQWKTSTKGASLLNGFLYWLTKIRLPFKSHESYQQLLLLLTDWTECVPVCSEGGDGTLNDQY